MDASGHSGKGGYVTNSLSGQVLSRLSDFVAESMGLDFPPERWATLERQAHSAAREFGFAETDPFVRWLLSTTLSQAQIEVLAGHLTIAETYFWREPQIFQALKTEILPELIRQRGQSNRRLRIWSAGCATGEEPYSIAILLRMLIPDLQKWHITLLATDINPKMLRSAAEGIYRPWSFRNISPEFKEAYFRPASMGRLEILPEIRQMVSFAYLNLARDIFPSALNNTNAMDLIFCRNVLMYFTPKRMQKAGHDLYNALVEGGWFVVSSSELSPFAFPDFSTVHFPGAIVYRRPPATRPAADGSAMQGAPPAPSQDRPPAPPDLPQADRPNRGADQAATEPVPIQDALATVRTLANQGKLQEAWTCCQQALLTDKLNLALHFMGATILQEQNREDEAMSALKQVLYLDPDFVLAHFALGNLAQRRGDGPATAKHFHNALALLETYKADDPLPEADGLTAGRLQEIIRATRQIGVLP